MTVSDNGFGVSHLLVPGRQLRVLLSSGVQASVDKSVVATIVPLTSAQTYVVSLRSCCLVVLGMTALFHLCAQILAASTITNTGPTTISGDVGLTGTSLTGAPTVNGVTNINNAAAGTALADAHTAFTSLNAKACTSTLAGIELGGLTLTPGVYCFSAANVQITGALVLDAQNNAAASFVFQVAGVLAVQTSSGVQMINGGSLCNVFWAITSGSMGTTAFMVRVPVCCVIACLSSGS